MQRQQMLDESLDDGPSKCSTFIYYTWKICTCIFSHVMLVSMVVSYCIAGAFTFEALEKNNEIRVKRNISLIRSNVTRDLWDLTKDSPVLHQDNWTMAVKTRLKSFEQDLLMSMKSQGWDGVDDETTFQWTFAGALFYSIIVITTIGYGHIAPKTHWGKIVTIFYAILGIPLMLLCLSNIGDILAHSFRFLYWRVCCYVCTKKPKRPQFKRGRSIRGSVRPGAGGPGRNSWRSASSFRRSARASQRSADSALGLSEAMTYSDTEYSRGFREDDTQGINRGRFSQHSRFSDTVLVAGRRPGQSPMIASVQDLPLDLAPGAPVLFNKYALEMETPQRDRGSLKTIVDPSSRQHLDIPTNTPPLSTAPLRRPAQRECRARIMSPMGFAISRQRQSRGPGDLPDWDMGTDYDYDDSSSGQRSKTKPVPIWLCVFLVVNYILCGAILFSTWEEWNFLDSAYFCFITLTTIGFGDFVPAQGVNQKDPEIRIALCSLYLLFGIALLAMSFNLVQEEVINNVKSVAKRLGIIKNDDEEEEEE